MFIKNNLQSEVEVFELKKTIIVLNILNVFKTKYNDHASSFNFAFSNLCATFKTLKLNNIFIIYIFILKLAIKYF